MANSSTIGMRGPVKRPNTVSHHEYKIVVEIKLTIPCGNNVRKITGLVGDETPDPRTTGENDGSLSHVHVVVVEAENLGEEE